MSKGFSAIFIIFGVLVLVGVVGGSYFLGRSTQTPPTKIFPAPTQKACTMEAKVCSDGSSVGRTGPNCEFSECPASKTDDVRDWKTYQVNALSLEYKLPNEITKYGDLKEQISPGEKGTLLYVSQTTNRDNSKIVLGTTSVDYQAGRGGMFVDLQGFKKENGKFYAKFVQGRFFDVPSSLATEFTNSHGLTFLKIKEETFDNSEERLPSGGNPGPGHIGALVNLNSTPYQGLAIDMTLTEQLTKDVFDQILSTFKHI